MTISKKNKELILNQVYNENYKQWIWPKQRGFFNTCCDCHLTHSFNFRVVKLAGGKRIPVNQKEYQVEFQLKENKFMTDRIRKDFLKLKIVDLIKKHA